jgi:HSP90 family molecular chaperone
MGKFFTELVKKHGLGIVMSAIAMDGYRRTVNNESKSKKLETIRAEAAAAKEAANQATQAEYKKNIAEAVEKAKICAVTGIHKEGSD